VASLIVLSEAPAESGLWKVSGAEQIHSQYCFGIEKTLKKHFSHCPIQMHMLGKSKLISWLLAWLLSPLCSWWKVGTGKWETD
jgi:hypothetical protein